MGTCEEDEGVRRGISVQKLPQVGKHVFGVTQKIIKSSGD